jgi:integrase
MPRLATGNVYERRGKWFARLTIGPKKRRSFMLAKCKTEEAAIERRALLAEMATKLRKSGRDDIAPEIIRRAADRDGKALEEVRRAVDMIAAGEVVAKNRTPTIEEIGKRWTSGELATLYPDRIKRKRSVRTDIGWLEKYIYPLVGHIAVDAFTLDHGEMVLQSLPPHLSPNTRRHIAQLMHRICGMAVLPLRYIKANPLPPGFVPPQAMGKKAKGWIYPDEDATIMACPTIPLPWRLFYGFSHREGVRMSEGLRLAWSDMDLTRGAVILDQNKTDQPRAWALTPGVASAMRRWRELVRAAGLPVEGDALVFVEIAGHRKGQPISRRESALRYRKHLERAGIARAELYAHTDARMRIRLHDTRATFITLALANGRTETWVQDRTGHKSSNMINLYRRAARTAAELGLGECRPLDQAIPELARGTGERAAEKAPREGGGGGRSAGKQRVSSELATVAPTDRNRTPPPPPGVSTSVA